MQKRDPFSIVVEEEDLSLDRRSATSSRFVERYLASNSSTLTFGWRKPARIELPVRQPMTSRYEGLQQFRCRRSPGARSDPRLQFHGRGSTFDVKRFRQRFSVGWEEVSGRHFRKSRHSDSLVMSERGRQSRRPDSDKHFSCVTCGREGFSRHASLVRHMRLVHRFASDELDRRVGVRTEPVGSVELETSARTRPGGAALSKSVKPTAMPKKDRHGEEIPSRKSYGHGGDRGRFERGVRSSLPTVAVRVSPEEGRSVQSRKSSEKQTSEGYGHDYVTIDTSSAINLSSTGSVSGAVKASTQSIAMESVPMPNFAEASTVGICVANVPMMLMEDDSEVEGRSNAGGVVELVAELKEPLKLSSAGEVEVQRLEETQCEKGSTRFIRATRLAVNRQGTTKSGLSESTGGKTTRAEASYGKKRRLTSASVSRERSLRCPDCKITFEVLAMFKMHRGLHNRRNAFECNDCGFVSADRVDFQAHFECRESGEGLWSESETESEG
jgi:hypothetical protein